MLADNIIVIYELLLLRDHVLQVDHGAGLQLEVQEELHVLTLQEVVLDDQLKEISYVLVLNSLLDGIFDFPYILVVLVQVVLHGLTFYQVLLGRLIQNQDLLRLFIFVLGHLLYFLLEVLD